MGSDQANGNTRTDETYDREFPDGGGFVSIVPAGPLTDTEVEFDTLVDSSARVIANFTEALLLSPQ